jgi:hypothetical protein
MGLYPQTSAVATPLVVHCGQYGAFDHDQTVPSSVAPTANRIYYMPLLLPFDYTAVRIGWGNGSTTTGRDVAIGLYSNDGALIFSTGVVSTGTLTADGAHYITPAAPWRVPAGTYYLAYQTSATHNVIMFGTGAQIGQGLEEGALLEDAASTGLPATMASAAPVGNIAMPLVVLTRSAT